MEARALWGMPGRKHAQQYMIVLADPGFYIGMRYFGKGQHIARDDPLADKILKECPTWVTEVIDLKKLNKEVNHG